jgi:predicted DsbA family dithiol-disulfide isomerase
MNETSPTCTANTCSVTESGSQPQSRGKHPSNAVLVIDVVSDVICPWCWIGKRRLEKALALRGHPQDVQVIWRPFQLNPQMPLQGIERRAYRIAKFGSWERSQALDAQVGHAGEGEGIEFAFGKMARTPNTFDAHRLIWLAQKMGVQDVVVETLFRAYFSDGLNLNDLSTLIALAAKAGIGADAERMLAGDEGRAEVQEEETRYKSLGVSSVPSFFFNGQFAFAGAAAPTLLADAIRQQVDHS